MSNHRYHVHLACVTHDVTIQTAQDDLSVFFEDKAFITRDLLVVGQESANYSRRCVNDCDVVVFIIGQEYGSVNQSGVSQLHLTYTNAKTKNKPMLIFASHDVANARNRHLADLLSSIQTQHPNITHFSAQHGLRQVIGLAFESLALPQHQWCDCENTKEKKSNPIEIKPIEPLEGELFDGILSTQKIELDLYALLPASVDEEVSLDCAAHVFEGGALTEVEFVFTLTWRRMLQALLELKSSFSEQGFSRCLNELIDKKQVDDMIAIQHPKSHAVSRHQIKKSELTRVKNELQAVGWVVSTGSNMMYAVSDDIKSLYAGGGGEINELIR